MSTAVISCYVPLPGTPEARIVSTLVRSAPGSFERLGLNTNSLSSRKKDSRKSDSWQGLCYGQVKQTFGSILPKKSTA